MNVPEKLGYTTVDFGFNDLATLQEQRKLDQLAQSAFQWNDKYLPFVIAGVGVLVVPLLFKVMKRRRKK